MTPQCAEQLSHDRHNQVPVNTALVATLEMIPAKFVLGYTKTGFHFPAAKGHPQQLSQRPAIALRNSGVDKVFWDLRGF